MISLRTALFGTTLLCTAPALAAIDPPPASKNDGRIRVVIYDPNNPVELHGAPGVSMRLEFGADEKIVDSGVVVSDQNTISFDPTVPPPPPSVNPFTGMAGQLGQTAAAVSSCDANMCRTVAGNIVYLKPVQDLDPQPLFIQTQRTRADGVVEQVPYTFEISARSPAPPGEVKTASLDPAAGITAPPTPPTLTWGVRFTYPNRIKEQQAADLKRRQEEWRARQREGAVLTRPVIDVPNRTSNVKYAYRGSESFRPDSVWDDGRSTYLRYNGNRRVPNVYSLLPSGEPTIPQNGPQPDGTGTTLKITGTAVKWFLADGSENGKPPVGCLINGGPDPEGRSSATVAGTP